VSDRQHPLSDPVSEPASGSVIQYFYLRTRQFQQKKQLFDVIRRKWIADTPEERVRQELLCRLTNELGYPAGQISIERRAQPNSGHQTTARRLAQQAATANPLGRYDALLRTTEGKPLLLIECKAPGIALDQSVFDQAAVYNYALNVPFLLLCNGPDFLMVQIDHSSGRYVFAPEIPSYPTLLALKEDHK
jgi:hypothetical protein